jgi:hypothetical protein
VFSAGRGRNIHTIDISNGAQTLSCEDRLGPGRVDLCASAAVAGRDADTGDVLPGTMLAQPDRDVRCLAHPGRERQPRRALLGRLVHGFGWSGRPSLKAR